MDASQLPGPHEPAAGPVHREPGLAAALTRAILLAFALARRFSRTASIAPILIAGITLGFASILAGGVASALGEVGVLPPALAAWAPPLTLAAIVLAIGLSGSRRLRPA